ncbi:ATPase [Georgfuchsia toluolica]|uniref:ATPase n=1 Tax=Georgfuchsia toluolica TaxID=424218 RepID=A0A916J4U5_9PROT|nr:diguanylate cyclase [Georgfuchsia toluolica]CAG4884587.1 ATPase [Georgfuchsia toluolica]
MNAMVRSWLAACCLLLMAGLACAQQQIRIGILAYQSKPKVQAQWAPLATALSQAIPGYAFAIDAYDHEQMRAAVTARNVDFVLTNPGDYVLMQHRNGLSAPLATLISREQDKPVTATGGVIFTPASRTDIRKLEDLRGKTVAIVSTESWDGYQIQAYELAQKGLRMPQDVQFALTDLSHDNVVDAILLGQADAGFVRTGVLESLAKKGKLDLAGITVLNRWGTDFPFQTSTRLYPEWPVAALAHTDRNLMRKVAAFLLSLDENAALTRDLHIYGFNVSANYSPVEGMLQELRMPPFGGTPVFTPQDVWKKYFWLIVAGLTAAGVFLLLWLRLLRVNHRLKTEKALVQSQAAELKKSKDLIHSVIEGTSDVIYVKDANGRYTLFNSAGAKLAGKSINEVIGKDDTFLLSHEEAREVMAADQLVMASGKVRTYEQKITAATGEVVTLHITKGPLFDEIGNVTALFCIARDITEKKKSEELIWRQASFDTLTGLPNRRMVFDRLEHEIKVSNREGIPLALLFIDLDHFKEVNDTLGHQAGDDLLKEAAQRLVNCVRESDTVGRYGGDEFVIILGSLEDIGSAERVAGELLLKLAEPFRLGEATALVSGSIGIAVHPNDARDVAILIKCADFAMYEAKRLGRNRFHFFSSVI